MATVQLGSADTAWARRESAFNPWVDGSYGINGLLSHFNDWDPDYFFKKDTAVQKPTQTPMFCDCIVHTCFMYETLRPSRNLYEPRLNSFADCAIARHGNMPASAAPRNVTSEVFPGSINMGFVDGHAQSVKLENLWAFYWHNRWDPNKVPWPHPPPK